MLNFGFEKGQMITWGHQIGALVYGYKESINLRFGLMMNKWKNLQDVQSWALGFVEL